MTLHHQFASRLASEPEALRPFGRNIVSNLQIIDSKLTCENDKEAARMQLGKNVKAYERKRASLIAEN